MSVSGIRLSFLQRLLNQLTNFYGRWLVFSLSKSNEYYCLSYVLIRIIFNNNMAIRRYGGSVSGTYCSTEYSKISLNIQ